MNNRSATIILASILVVVATMIPKFTIASEPFGLEPVPNLLKLPKHITLGRCSAVAVNSKNQIFLFHRGRHPVICFNANGEYVRSWGDDVIGTAHGLRVDSNDDLWVTDTGHHLVMKFSPTGKLLLALGKSDKPGSGVDQFNKPTDVAFGARGEIYVSDGYGNSRVMKFSVKGKFIKQWGERGKKPGQFNLPHSILVDKQGRILVGDRENNRVQVFDSEGKLLKIWSGFAPFGLVADRDETIFVADGRANQLLRLDAAGKVAQRWGRKGRAPGEFNLPHMLAVDRNANLYVVEIGGMRLQKFIRKR